MRSIVLVVLASAALTAFGDERVFYVSPHGDDSRDGSSHENAFRTVKRARDAARGLAETARIVLADGEYDSPGSVRERHQPRPSTFQPEIFFPALMTGRAPA